MKFDKDIIVGIIICAAVLFGWDPLCKYMGWTSEPVPATPVQTAPAVEKTALATPVAAAPKKKAAAVKTTVKLPAVILANKDLSYKISPVTGSVDSITLADYKNAAQTGPVVLEKIPQCQRRILPFRKHVLGSGKHPFLAQKRQ